MTLRGKRLQKSTLHQLLRKRIYSGDFDYDGTTYKGTHDPIVTKEVWDSVQRILDKRNEHHTHTVKRSFPFSGLVTCGNCGCQLVAELKKDRYVYYHCTGNRGKCGVPYTRQETLVDQFASTLSTLVIPTPILDWLHDELTNKDTNEQGAREERIKRLENERSRCNARLSTLYDDRLEKRITSTLYDEKAHAIQAQLDKIEQQLATARDNTAVPLTAALDLVRLTSNACHAFREQNEEEQRKLLTMLIKEATWKDDRLQTSLLEPFEQLRRSNQLSHTKDKGKGGSGRDLKIWLLG